MRHRWQPILRGDTAKRADTVITRIADALAAAIPSLTPASAHWHQGAPAEFALFFGYLAAATGRPEHKQQALNCLQLAVELFPAAAGLGLHSGLSGLAWTVQHLQRPPARLEIDPDDICGPADDVLLERLVQVLSHPEAWTEFDLINGFSGYGVYFLSRLPSRKAARGLKLIIARLEAAADKMPNGIAWHTPAKELPAHLRKVAPHGYYNLGLAHGLPGVIGFLAEAYARGIERKRAWGMVEGAVSWMLAQRLPANPVSVLPAWVAPGHPPGPSRLVWCYGDLGAAVALLNAARKTGRRDWEGEALALGRKAAVCAPRLSGVKDACVCHGTAGNAHLFNRLFQATGDKTFLGAAGAQFQRALRLRGTGKKLAGYAFWTSLEGAPALGWGADASLLGGLAGLGLALLSATRPVAPSWAELLLLV
jgi:lantibiotic biosynthesis protein